MSMKTKLIGAIAALVLLPSMASAAEVAHSTVGVQGYDVVGYFTEGKPVKGNGENVVVHEGVNYLFATEANKKAFEASPDKYLPQYGGWCAFGVSVNKKFIGDPTVWKIVDGKLYLNLSRKVSDTWVKDIPGNLAKANTNWPAMADKAPSEL
ncbi:MAG: YHS domain-containing (seleno)protein [Rickettsiales bacterium]